MFKKIAPDRIKRLDIDDLARKSGVSKSAIIHIRGGGACRYETWRKLVRAMKNGVVANNSKFWPRAQKIRVFNLAGDIIPFIEWVAGAAENQWMRGRARVLLKRIRGEDKKGKE